MMDKTMMIALMAASIVEAPRPNESFRALTE